MRANCEEMKTSEQCGYMTKKNPSVSRLNKDSEWSLRFNLQNTVAYLWRTMFHVRLMLESRTDKERLK